MDLTVKFEIAPWDSCIPDLACTVVCPEVFVFDARLRRVVVRREYSSGVPWRGVAEGKLAVCVEKAALACPMKIIRVISATG